MHTYVTRKYRTRKCSRESLYKWIMKHKLLDLNMIDWKYLQDMEHDMERTLVRVSSWRQLKGKTGRNLKRSRATLTRRAEGMEDLPMNKRWAIVSTLCRRRRERCYRLLLNFLHYPMYKTCLSNEGNFAHAYKYSKLRSIK